MKCFDTLNTYCNRKAILNITMEKWYVVQCSVHTKYVPTTLIVFALLYAVQFKPTKNVARLKLVKQIRVVHFRF
jgi:hypothetical protein